MDIFICMIERQRWFINCCSVSFTSQKLDQVRLYKYRMTIVLDAIFVGILWTFISEHKRQYFYLFEITCFQSYSEQRQLMESINKMLDFHEKTNFCFLFTLHTYPNMIKGLYIVHLNFFFSIKINNFELLRACQICISNMWKSRCQCFWYRELSILV